MFADSMNLTCCNIDRLIELQILTGCSKLFRKFCNARPGSELDLTCLFLQICVRKSACCKRKDLCNPVPVNRYFQKSHSVNVHDENSSRNAQAQIWTSSTCSKLCNCKTSLHLFDNNEWQYLNNKSVRCEKVLLLGFVYYAESGCHPNILQTFANIAKFGQLVIFIIALRKNDLEASFLHTSDCCCGGYRARPLNSNPAFNSLLQVQSFAHMLWVDIRDRIVENVPVNVGAENTSGLIISIVDEKDNGIAADAAIHNVLTPSWLRQDSNSRKRHHIYWLCEERDFHPFVAEYQQMPCAGASASRFVANLHIKNSEGESEANKFENTSPLLARFLSRITLRHLFDWMDICRLKDLVPNCCDSKELPASFSKEQQARLNVLQTFWSVFSPCINSVKKRHSPLSAQASARLYVPPNATSVTYWGPFLLILCIICVTVSAQDVDLSLTLSVEKGFRIIGAAADDDSGKSVKTAGDVNGDGISDIIVGAPNADPPSRLNAGISYVIFGRNVPGGATPFGDVQLTTDVISLTAGIGFRILGAQASDQLGRSVSAAGDVNKDGIGDVIVGATGGIGKGIAYVIFGRSLAAQVSNPFNDIQLPTTVMSASIGFRILGSSTSDNVGQAVSAAGDVNGDGTDDVIIGAPDADPTAGSGAGIVYVIFGRNIPGGATPFGDIQLTTGSTALAASIGFRILGSAGQDFLGMAVSGARDVNGDGIHDVIAGATLADPPGKSSGGIAYVIFGRNIPGGAAAFGDVQLPNGVNALSVNVGFRILGAAGSDQCGYSVSVAGDVNGDGVGDIIVGARLATGSNIGISYVIFGRSTATQVSNPFGDIQLPTSTMSANLGFRILGAATDDASGESVSAAGDVNTTCITKHNHYYEANYIFVVNGDGVSDVIVGADKADPFGKSNAGSSYVIFGRNIAGGATPFGDIQLTTGTTAMAASIGFRILGAEAEDWNGGWVAPAGDVNGDNADDIVVSSYNALLGKGISYVLFGVSPQPTSQPSSQPSRQPSVQPSRQPSRQPTSQPTRQPTRQPSSQPSIQPSRQPTNQPSSQPSSQPTQPSSQPSRQPTAQPSHKPSAQPSQQPSRQPSIKPSTQPTSKPSRQPSVQPSLQPSALPTNQPSRRPSTQPSAEPSVQPSSLPSTQPSAQPTIQPSAQPLSRPTSQPTNQPSARPSDQPTTQPLTTPSTQPSIAPSAQPSIQPSSRPSSRPSNQPSAQPSTQPSSQPTSQPSLQPFSHPTRLPSGQPSGEPSAQPSIQPSVQPSEQPSTQPSTKPSEQPSAQPTIQPSLQPSTQPSHQPSVQPSTQPSVQPIGNPSSQPSQQPFARPSSQPSTQPSKQPSSQPSSRPSAQPSAQPSWQPSVQPSIRPTVQPTEQPSALPSLQPSSQPYICPSTQPSAQPSEVPSSQPSTWPTGQPTKQPSSQPSKQPVGGPSSQPSAQPSVTPTCQPSDKPSVQPSEQPSALPSVQPSCQPSVRPSKQPSSSPTVQPSAQPSSQPTTKSSAIPTVQPSSQPSTLPSRQPTEQPSGQPSYKPSTQPSEQPSARPTTQPSAQPTTEPSAQPSVRPSSQPSVQPSGQPSVWPTDQPTSNPSRQPSAQPSEEPTVEPSAQPSGRPSNRPTTQPTAQPYNEPSSQPSCSPSAFPSGQPSIQPSVQPSNQPSATPTMQALALPSSQPSTQPSLLPTAAPTGTHSLNTYVTNGEWVATINNTVVLGQVSCTDGTVWACGMDRNRSKDLFCAEIDAVLGAELARYLLPWSDITSVFHTHDVATLVLTGHNVAGTSVTSNIATCVSEPMQLVCNVKSFPGMTIEIASYAPFAKQSVYIGKFAEEVSVTVFDASFSTQRSYLYDYTTSIMLSIDITLVQCPQKFVGAFVAGTSVTATSINYIFAGVVRTDTGSMNAMYIFPARGSIVNSAELVNTMALEEIKPDSFIAGGLQLDDGGGMHAYLVRVNSFFHSVEYTTRYKIRQDSAFSRRRSLRGTNLYDSAVKGSVLVGSDLFMTIDVIDTTDARRHSSVSIVKADTATGFILQQVQIASTSASIRCTNLTTLVAAVKESDVFLYLLCAVRYNNNTTQALVLSVKSDLALSQLPFGFSKYHNDTLRAERVAFHRSVLPISVRSTVFGYSESSLSFGNGNPSRKPSLAPTSQPSAQPFSSPSSQPSSNPTAAPSISPQPTSQPSSSGPTNTYKPTAKPTQRPSARPSSGPSERPSKRPTVYPTLAPSLCPSVKPSCQPSAAPTMTLTRAPHTRKPTPTPTIMSTDSPTMLPLVTNSIVAEKKSNSLFDMSMTTIFGVCAAGLFAMFLLYQLVHCCRFKIGELRKDKKRVVYMTRMNLPAKPQFPLFSAFIALFCTIIAGDVQELEEVQIEIEEEEEENEEEEVEEEEVEEEEEEQENGGEDENTDGTALQSLLINDLATEPTGETAAIAEAPAVAPVTRGAHIDNEPYQDLEANMQSTQSASANTDATEVVVAAPGAAPAAPVTTSAPEAAPIVQSLARSCSNDTFASLHSSDDSSYMSEIVNAMVDTSTQPSESASGSTGTSGDNNSVSTDSDSDDSDDDSSAYFSGAEDMV